MSDSTEKRTHGMMAEFDSVDSLLAAGRRIREAGYTKIDAYTPFAVHGIDEALGIKPTALPWICLAGGVLGAVTALVMQIWMNAIDYPYIISGKPYISLPAFIPVSFELTILFASFGTFFGMLALNRLPRFSNPVFTNSRFDAATDDKFFLYIAAEDPRYDQEGVARLLGDAGAASVDPVVEDDSPTAVPKLFYTIVGALLLLSIIPPLIGAKMRVTTNPNPRYHVIYDMDFSPAKQAQRVTTIFTDGRVMRPDVPGTIARTRDSYDADFTTGVDVEALAAMDPHRAEALVKYNLQPPTEEGAEGDSAEPQANATADRQANEQNAGAQPPGAQANGEAGAAAPEDNTPWLEENPLEVNEQLLVKGQRIFNIYCAVCHGINGRGDGLVNRRAQRVQSQTWVQPTSLHEDNLVQERYPDGKLFNVITNGIRKMPSYASQITPADRWAVVAYVRALQLSRNASESDVPAEQRAAVAQAE